MVLQADDPTNEQLVNSSYFEDKLVGDLLAKGGIQGVDKGYRTLVRRTFATGVDKQIWEYGLHATSTNNVKVVHTESDEFRLAYGKKVALDGVDNSLLFRDATKTMSPEFYSDKECSPVIEKIKVDENQIRQSEHITILVHSCRQ